MNRKVFRYRSASNIILAVFLACWSTGWFAAVAAALITGSININHHEETVSEAVPMLALIGMIGLLGAVGAVGATLFALNARVELEDGWISSFNFLGKRTARGGLTGCKFESAKSPWGTGNMGVLKTDGGEIKVFKSLIGYWTLVGLIDPRQEAAVEVSFQPEREAFDYRWTSTHLLSFLFLAIGVGGPVAMILQEAKKADGSLIGAAVFSLLAILVFGGLGLYLQLQGWNEKILLKDGIITWIDCLGRTRIQSPCGTLLDLQYSPSNSTSSRNNGSLQFTTPNGSFQANGSSRGFETLRSDMAKLITEVREKRKHLEVSS